MTLSFIIPVYNAEQTIIRCVDSIINSGIDKFDYEIVLVNDGSIDNSLEVCEELRKGNNNIVVCSQTNAGASSARNKGLALSKGKYIWFVDADDFVDTANLVFILDMVKQHGECEVFGFDYIQSGQRRHDFYGKLVEPGVAYLDKNTRLYLWNHIYSRDAIGEIRFLDGTKNIEDWLFNLEVLVNVSSVLHLSVVGYHYCEDNQLSTSRNRSKQHLEKLSQDTFAVHMSLLEFVKGLKSEDKKDVLLSALNFSVIGHFYSLFKFYEPQSVRNAVDIYKDLGLYPLKKTNNKRANSFRLFANRFYLMYNIMRIKIILK